MLRRTLALSAIALAAGLAAAPAGAAGDVVVGLDANVIGLDPSDLNDNLSMSVSRTIVQGLYGFDKDMKIVPLLAESTDASETADDFTVHLRHGVSFSDGAPFNAAAVKTSFDRARDPANHLKRASLYAPIDTVTAVDDYTVKIKLKAPFGAFINNLAHQAYAVMSPKAIAQYGKEVDRHPAGTGPYMLSSWSSPDTVKVVRNPNYWRTGVPKVDSITFKSVPESGSRIAMLQTGEAQFIFPLPVESVKIVEKDPNLDITAGKSIFAFYVALNNMRKPFTDPRVREALNYAVDKQAMIKVVYGGYASPLDSVLPPLLSGYVKQDLKYPYDPAKAKALLAAAGYPDGFESVLWGGNSTASQKAMQFLQQQFALVGVKVQVEPLESGTAAARVWSVKTPEEATTMMYYTGWSASTGDADWGLRPLLYGKSFPPNLFNTAYYANPTFDAAIETGLSTADAAKRQAAYTTAQAQAWKDAPWIFLVSTDNLSAKSKKLSGIYVMPDGQLLTEDAALN
jgi:glutathione transport system substrate-binding protein